MSKRDFLDWRTTQQKIAMGEKVGRLKEFKDLQETACVHLEERELVAYIGVYELVNPEDKEFIKFLKEVAKPALIKIGRQRWYRDTITDLSLALSYKERSTRTEDAKDSLEEEIE